MIDWIDSPEPNEGDDGGDSCLHGVSAADFCAPCASPCTHGDACDLVLTDRGDTLVCCLCGVEIIHVDRRIGIRGSA